MNCSTVELLTDAHREQRNVRRRSNLIETPAGYRIFLAIRLSFRLLFVFHFSVITQSGRAGQGRTGERASEMESYGLCVSAREMQGRGSRLSVSLALARTPEDSISLARSSVRHCPLLCPGRRRQGQEAAERSRREGQGSVDFVVQFVRDTARVYFLLLYWAGSRTQSSATPLHPLRGEW